MRLANLEFGRFWGADFGYFQKHLEGKRVGDVFVVRSRVPINILEKFWPSQFFCIGTWVFEFGASPKNLPSYPIVENLVPSGAKVSSL